MVDGAYGMSSTITQEVINPLAGLSNSYGDNKTDKLKYKPKSEISDELVEKIINHLN